MARRVFFSAPCRHSFRAQAPPEKLKAYFAAITTSDVAHTGLDNRKKLNGAFVDLIRLVNAGDPVGYPWHPQLKQTLMDLTLNVYRNADTGWWGETYIHNGKREYIDDLSMTFHIVHALDGEVPLKDRLATTLFAVKNADYPVGWMDHGIQSNHNNMDVIVLMRDSWKSMTDAQRQRGAEEIRRMLHWCLTESLQPDGSFRSTPSKKTSTSASLFSRVSDISTKAGASGPKKAFQKPKPIDRRSLPSSRPTRAMEPRGVRTIRALCRS